MFRTPGIKCNACQFLGDHGLLPLATDDFFRARLDQMIDLRTPWLCCPRACRRRVLRRR